ncbi:MAG: hypothetical protein COW18_09795 [Zetaproteobacteria bacterium CG12_big_fil_rev_8_21_14_0_65_54_13]|nr:MAG: hypothetical protein COW18_09795 [Zetaproteobacteria bacterium CG12_big_fil_rev_8_21_14_0_65_54_13]PIX53889.1 MAG: hypothetical protein COZ50_10975 [Zetaproteobacteria bacterium CG_4_10_14_3_um_filter_54_28]PJA28588.1 MAG: hypothetical protein CO188_08910 [Zetaproteobacteria bacterium CG_4_9_14_3_um_filter_54_145]
MKKFCIRLVGIFWCLNISGVSHASEIEPFQTRNQNPFIPIFGLPVAEAGFITQPGELKAAAFLDLSNSFSGSNLPGERVWIDGQTSRYTLLVRYGLSAALEAGIEVPLVHQGGGSTDALIDNFHKLFGFSPAGRNRTARNQISYLYASNGVNQVNVNRSGMGVGDITLSGAYQLWGNTDTRSLALRAGLKLPTGESATLHGSGSTDLSLWLACSDPETFSAWDITVFGSIGALALGNAKVMQNVQRHAVAFGSMGLGWRVSESIVLKAQIDGHTPFYNSSLDELGLISAQLVFGGSIDLSEKMALDIALSEDIVVASAPDIVFHLALRTKF